MSLQQVTCLTRLNLSAAFDTIDHSVLLKGLLSWFGITSNALSWIEFYLLNRSFSVNIEGSKSSSYQLLYGVHLEPVLGPILYSTPLSKVISESSSSHKLYADGTSIILGC